MFQAHAGMPSPAEPQTEQHRDSDLLCHHDLHADCSVDGSQADDKQFADGYAQTVTFGLLMARSNNIKLPDHQQRQSGRLALFLRGFSGSLRQQIAESNRVALHAAGGRKSDDSAGR